MIPSGLVGMSSFSGGPWPAPLGTALLALELSGSLALLLPMMIAAAMAAFAEGDCHLYPFHAGRGTTR